MKYDLKKEIKKQVYNLILEEAEKSSEKSEELPKSKKGSTTRALKPGTISTVGAFGTGGRAKQFIADAKSRSQLDPEGLMKDLKIEKAEGNSDLQRSLSVINQAIHLNDLMSMAYQGATLDYIQDGEAGRKEAVVITTDRLDVKNGIRFMALVLDGAKNAEILNIENAIQFKTISGHIALLEIDTK